MKYPVRQLEDPDVLRMMHETPHPPKSLYIRGSTAPKGHIYLTIVGSRVCSEYGKQVVDEICQSLEGQPVSIVSGLAHGIDTYTHKMALKYNLHTIAVVGSGLEDKVLYPQSNVRLAQKILDAGGALVSEQDPSMTSKFWMFPARNRLMVGISRLVIIIEAKAKSGTLITSRLATDYNRDVMVVPSSIYSEFSKGSNELIKQGAYMYTRPSDIFELLKLDMPESMNLFSYTPSEVELVVLHTIKSGHTRTNEIIECCSKSLSVSEIIQAIQNLEIQGVVKRMDGMYVVI